MCTVSGAWFIDVKRQPNSALLSYPYKYFSQKKNKKIHIKMLKKRNE